MQRQIECVIKIIEEGWRCRIPKRVVILGPKSCGKTALLGEISKSYHLLPHAARLIPIRIDLKAERFKALAQPSLQVGGLLLRSPILIDLLRSVEPAKRPIAGQTLFSAAVRKLLQLFPDRHFILELDNLEATPQAVVQVIGQELNGIYEDVADPGVQRFCQIACGSLCLQELHVGEQSLAWRADYTVTLPAVDLADKIATIRQQMAPAELATLSAKAIETIATWAGADPVFLEPLLNEVRLLAQRGRVAPAHIKKAAIEMSGLETSISALREGLLEFDSDPVLREKVAELLSGIQARRSERTTDVDRLQVSGLLVAQKDCYEFRNMMVRHFMEQMADRMGLLNPWAVRDKQEPPGNLGAFKSVWMLNRIRHCLPESLNLLQALEELSRAWLVLTSHSRAQMLVSFRDDRRRQWRYDVGRRSLRRCDPVRSAPVSPADGAGLPDRVVAVSLESGKNEFDVDLQQLVVAVPLDDGDSRVVIGSAVSRMEGPNAWSESSLRHWLRFLTAVHTQLLQIIVAEVQRSSDRQQPENNPFSADTCESKLKRNSGIHPVRTLAFIDRRCILISAPDVYGGSSVIEPHHIEEINDACRHLGSNPAGSRYRADVLQVASRMNSILADPKMVDAMVADSHSRTLIVTGDLEQLKIPFELLPVKSGSHLGLQLAVTRHISGLGLGLSPRTWHQLLTERHDHSEPLRVLLVGVNDGTLNAVVQEIEQVTNYIRSGCLDRGIQCHIEPLVGSAATLPNVLTQLRRSCWDIVHFSGHGTAIGAEDEGIPIPISTEGAIGVLTAGQIREVLEQSARQQSCPYMVYLSTCNNGAISGDLKHLLKNNLGTIHAVVAAGVTTVLAHRWAIGDLEAAIFAESFYKALFASDSNSDPPSAAYFARKKLSESSASWGSAVLIYQAATNG